MSDVKQETAPNTELALWDVSEIIVGKQLGSGGFCHVYEILSFCVNLQVNANLTEQQVKARLAMVHDARIHHARTHESKYAVKFLHLNMAETRGSKMLSIARRDIETETRVLQHVNHENIIKIHGCGIAGTPEESNERDRHLIILDRLDETLTERLEHWKKQDKRLNHPVMTDLLDKRGLKRRQFLIERLQVATEIASALEYLHENRIIYRDLKPSNVGFSKTGQVKLIDMGLAKELPDENENLGDTYKMTGVLGTYRYMAPEVAMKLPYNELADVYSFAHVLYNIMELGTAYEDLSKLSHHTMVARAGERPPIDCGWPTAIQELLERAWSSDLNERPSMTEVISVLKQVTDMLIKDKVVCDAKTVLTDDSLEQQVEKTPIVAPATISFCTPVYHLRMI